MRRGQTTVEGCAASHYPDAIVVDVGPDALPAGSAIVRLERYFRQDTGAASSRKRWPGWRAMSDFFSSNSPSE